MSNVFGTMRPCWPYRPKTLNILNISAVLRPFCIKKPKTLNMTAVGIKKWFPQLKCSMFLVFWCKKSFKQLKCSICSTPFFKKWLKPLKCSICSICPMFLELWGHVGLIDQKHWTYWTFQLFRALFAKKTKNIEHFSCGDQKMIPTAEMFNVFGFWCKKCLKQLKCSICSMFLVYKANMAS